MTQGWLLHSVAPTKEQKKKWRGALEGKNGSEEVGEGDFRKPRVEHNSTGIISTVWLKTQLRIESAL